VEVEIHCFVVFQCLVLPWKIKVETTITLKCFMYLLRTQWLATSWRQGDPLSRGTGTGTGTGTPHPFSFSPVPEAISLSV